MKLSPTALSRLQATMALIQQHQISLDALKDHFNKIIQVEFGIDITKGNWELDPETGELAPRQDEEKNV